MRTWSSVGVVLTLTLGAAVTNAQQKATTADGKVVILNPNGTWKYETPPPTRPAPGKAPAAAKEPEPEKKSERKLTRGEKVATWNGEKVVLLVDPKEGIVTGSATGLGTLVHLRAEKGESHRLLSAAAYGGKTGTIVETSPDVVIRMDDSGEEIVSSKEYGYGFIGEMKTAETLIGKRIWQKGHYDRALVGTPLKVTRASWGKYGIVLDVQTNDGDVNSNSFGGRDCIQERLHLECERSWNQTEQFFLEDPRKLYPTWTLAQWRMIEAGTIEAGMTEDMLRAVCGYRLIRIGGQWIEEKKVLAGVFECDDKRIMVSNNRIVDWKRK